MGDDADMRSEQAEADVKALDSHLASLGIHLSTSKLLSLAESDLINWGEIDE